MSVLDILTQQLDDKAIQQMGNQLGVDDNTASQAVSAALPMLIGALANNSSQSGGAQALASALDRDHDGGILDDVVGFLGQGSQSSGLGAGILKHILGGRQGNAENALGKVAGLNSGQAGQLLSMLAPLVMGALAKQKQSGGLDAGALAGMLAGDRQRVERAQPQAGSFLQSVIDRDGDGNIADDIAEIGGGLLSSFLKNRR